MGFRQENPRRQWKWFPCFASVKDNHVETGDEEADMTETVKFSVAYSLGEAVWFLPFVEEEFWCLWLSQSALTVNLTQLKKKKKKISQLSNWFYQVDLCTLLWQIVLTVWTDEAGSSWLYVVMALFLGTSQACAILFILPHTDTLRSWLSGQEFIMWLTGATKEWGKVP